jgi:hypothetical protein
MKGKLIVVVAAVSMCLCFASSLRGETVEAWPGSSDNVIALQVVNGYERAIPSAVIRIAGSPAWATFASKEDTLFDPMGPGDSAIVSFHFEVSPMAAQDASGNILFLVNSAGGKEEHSLQVKVTLPEKPVLYQNRPNPFSRGTSICYIVPCRSKVRVRIYDVTGRLVCNLIDATQIPGAHVIEWFGETTEGHLAPAGAYFCQLSVGEKLETRKMILLR